MGNGGGRGGEEGQRGGGSEGGQESHHQEVAGGEGDGLPDHGEHDQGPPSQQTLGVRRGAHTREQQARREQVEHQLRPMQNLRP